MGKHSGLRLRYARLSLVGKTERAVPMATQLIGGNCCSCGCYGNMSYDFSMVQVHSGAPFGGGMPVFVVISTFVGFYLSIERRTKRFSRLLMFNQVFKVALRARKVLICHRRAQ